MTLRQLCYLERDVAVPTRAQISTTVMLVTIPRQKEIALFNGLAVVAFAQTALCGYSVSYYFNMLVGVSTYR